MDYRESLDYLYGLQRFGIKLGLENIRRILHRLQHPEEHFPVVHVAGSNGKGSVCAGLASIAHQAGHRVGLFSSPHLHSFTERIQVDGRPISESDAVELIRAVREASRGVSVTFFEFTTAMALLHFQRRKVALAILEVGMGGRLDATNVVLPRVTVVTPICWDHAEHLGGDLKSIAAEKAGLLKPRVPLVLGRQSASALQVVIDRARELQVPAYCYGPDFSVRSGRAGFAYHGLDLTLTDLHSGLCGVHQHHNMGLALAAAEVLRGQGFQLPEAALRKGVAAVRWPGRLEWWQDAGTVLLDGAHNEGGAEVLAAYLGSLTVRAIRWVVGAKANKDIERILRPVLPLVARMYCTTPPVEEAFEAEQIARLARAGGVPARTFSSPASAMAAAEADRQPGEIILVAGSLFLVAAIRDYLMTQERAEQ